MSKKRNRKRNRQTRPQEDSNQAWKNAMKKDFTNPISYQIIKHERYYNHYYSWLQQIAYQLNDWTGFPDDIPENLAEIYLVDDGSFGYIEDTKYGNVLVRGNGTMVGNYNQPTFFQSVDKYYYDLSYPVYYFGRIKFKETQGLVCYNKLSSFNSVNGMTDLEALNIYATQLAFIKVISDINVNTQKTPYIITYEDDLLLEEVQRLFLNVDGNMPVMFTKAVLDEDGKKVQDGQIKDMLQVLKLNTPLLAEQLDVLKQKVWDEAMSHFGLMSMAQRKKERSTEAEAQSNIQQIQATQNARLKSRREFCKLADQLYGRKLTVRPSNQIIETEVGGYEFATVDGNTDELLRTGKGSARINPTEK